MNIKSTNGIQQSINVSITTSGSVISGVNTDIIQALSGGGGGVVVSLSVNEPYALSVNSLIFNDAAIGIVEVKTVNILNNGLIVGTKSIQVTWQ